MTNYADLLPVAHQAVDMARHIMRTMQPGSLTAKGDRDMASEVDYAIEESVRAFLAEQTPGIGFLGEENGSSGAATGLKWALDPVDGTVNFIHGSPLCAISLGLLEGDRSVLGIIDLPMMGHRYYATDGGGGAFLDGRIIRASATCKIDEAVVAIGDYAVGLGAEQKNEARFALTRRLGSAVQRIRMHGSAAIDLAWLAAGKVDAVVMLSNKPWDTAAGIVIARESGALIVDCDGSPHTASSGATIASNPFLMERILSVVADH